MCTTNVHPILSSVFLGVAIDAEAYRTGSGRTSRASSICLRRIIGSMFIRMNSKCAH